MKILPVFPDQQSLVDNDTYAWLSHYKWSSTKGYAVIAPKSRLAKKHKTTLMHRMIMNAERGQQLDHANGNKLDNRRSNLRFCTDFSKPRKLRSA